MSYTMLRPHINEILSLMGKSLDVVAHGCRDALVVRFSSDDQHLQPLFWVSLADWYCEREHQDLNVLPDWTPADLVWDVQTQPPRSLVFPSFRLVTL